MPRPQIKLCNRRSDLALQLSTDLIGRFHPLFLLAVISLNYFNTRTIAQCVEILVLPGRPMMIGRFVYYARRKVFDQDDFMIISQKRLDEKHEIKPFVGRITK